MNEKHLLKHWLKSFCLCLICCCLGCFTQVTAQNASSQRTLTGVVVDAKTGDPALGASVLVKGTTNGVITDFDGKFSIKVSPNNVLVISYIGYVPQEIKVGNQKSITVKLEENSEQLEEVVVTAFGTGQKKESVVGSIQSVRPKDLIVPASNLSTSFAGRLAGVVAYQRSGQPGSNDASFYIRGISTLSGITSPLIILDGVEVSSADLNALDPEIIESFSILKDATATAMYGTRGANGVMIVTTKSGSALDKPIIGLRVEANVATPTKVPDFVSGVEYMNLYNEAVTNQNTGNLLYSDEKIYGTANGLNPYIYPNVNWYDEIFKELSFNQKANFNIRGGSNKITYFMNLSVNHETGMLKDRSADFYSYSNNIDLMKYAFQNNIDFKMSKTSTISLHLNAQLNDMRQPNSSMGNIYGAIMQNNPVDFPVYYERQPDDLWWKWGILSGGNQGGAVNPMAVLTNGYSNYFESTVIANLDFEQKLDFITKGLRAKALVSFKNWSRSSSARSQGSNFYIIESYEKDADGQYQYDLVPVGTPSKPILGTSGSTAGDRRIYFQAFVDYNRAFGKNNVNGMLLYNQDEYNTNTVTSLVTSLPKRKMGFAARVSYDFDRRYMIEFNAGYNGSENFAKGHRWGFFPSAAVGWNVSQEKFWEPVSTVVSNFKLRGSYGLVGNDQIGGARYIYLADVSLQGSPAFSTGYGNNKITLQGPTYNRYQNNNITWEVGRKMNVGADIQLFQSLNIAVDGFQEIRSNIFQQKQSIPNYLGTAGTVIYANLAKVKNWGFDMSADYGKVINRNFQIQFKGTFTFARNRILEYDEAPGLRPALSMIGKSLNVNYGYVTDGLYIDRNDIANSAKSQIGNIAIAPGDIKYLDQPDANGEYDGIISTDDRVTMGFPTVPEVVYGFGPTMSYKNWDFSFFFQGAARTSLMMSGFHPFGTQYNRNVLSFVAADYWSESNQNPYAAYPRLTKDNNNHNTVASDYWLRDASFLKLKNIELGYSYKNMRVYASGLNVLTFSPFKHWDPEMGGGAGLQYPTQRVFNLGLQVTFK